jgi:prevent-host-death family protein
LTIGVDMEKIAISEFKAKCLAVLDRVHKTRKPICVTRHGTPVAEVIPPSAVQERSSWIASMKGSVKILGDIISPANEEGEWEVEQD